MEAAKTTLDSEICKEKKEKIEKALIRLQLAEEDKNREKEASAYKDLAWLYHVVEDYKQSITYGEKLLSISTKMRNKELQANACHVLALAHKIVEDYEKSEHFCSQLLRIGNELKDERLKASAYEVQAWLCFSKKNYAESSQEGKKFRNASKKLGDKRLEAEALDVLSKSYRKEGNDQESRKYAKKLLRISKELGNKEKEAEACDALAKSYCKEGYDQLSRKYANDLLGISKELGNKKLEAEACDVLTKSYCKGGNDPESRKYAKELLRISNELGNKKQEAEACDVLTKSYCKEGNDPESRKYAKKLLRISKELGNKKLEAKACDVLTKLLRYCKEGNDPESRKYAEELLRISNELGNKKLEAEACDVLIKSLRYCKEGNDPESRKYAEELLRIGNELGNKKLEAEACDVLTKSYFKEENDPESRKYAKKLLRISKELGNKKQEAEAYDVLTKSYCKEGNDQESRKYAKESLRISKELGNKKQEAEAYDVLTKSYCKEGNDPESRKYAKELLRISKELGNKKQEAEAYDVLTKSYCKEENDPESRKYSKELLRISKELGNREQEVEAYVVLAKSYCKERNDQESRKYAKELLRISKELGNKEQEAQALEFLGKSNVEVGDSEENKGSSKASPHIAKENWDKTNLEAEACGCSVPSEIEARGPRAKLAYKNALKKGEVKVYRARIMLIGQGRAGKTSLKKSLLGLPFDSEKESTEGIKIDPSQFEIDIKQAKNWKRTDEKFGVSQFAYDLAMMVARELQENKDKKRCDEKKVDKEDEVEEEGKLIVNLVQGMSEKDKKETNSPVSTDLEIRIDFSLPPEQFTDQLVQLLEGDNPPIAAKTGEHHMILDLWDFPGQHEYYASYPVFLSPRAAYLLVYDLSKGLKDIVQPCFNQGLKETNLENLLSWLVSISTRGSPKPEVNDQNCRPPVFIVGTHADKPREDIAEMKKQIQREISEKDYERHVIRPIFSVDNTQGSSDKGVIALQEEIMKVLKEEPYMGEELPIRWFNFEKVIQALTDKKIYCLTFEQLKGIIQKVCFINDGDEVATMLDFYHDLGVIVKHRDTVVLQAQWLMKVFKEFVTIPSFDETGRKHSRLWRKMETTGVLEMKLVDHLFSKCCLQQGLIKKDILNMMEQFGLIVKITPPTNEIKYFVVPCQLKTPPQTNPEMALSDPCPLYLRFLGGFVPHGFFWQLVSRCSRWCSKGEFKHVQPPKVFLAASKFVIKKEHIHYLILFCKKRFIKVILTHSQPVQGASFAEAREVAILVRTFLEETVQDLRREHSWLSNFNCDFCVLCPDCLQKEEECCIHEVVFCDHEDCLCFLEISFVEGKLKHCPKTLEVKEKKVVGLEKWFAVDKVVRPGYHPGTDFIYNMTAARPRGITLIINNKSFAHHSKHGKLPDRPGSEKDVSLVEELFGALDFSVKTRQDLTKQKVQSEVDDIVCQNHSAYDCFVLWLMSHGKSGEVFCSDGDTISIQTLYDMFSDCDSLKGKPKLFFIQACRGTREDEGVKVSVESATPANKSNESTKVDTVIELRIPKYSDSLFAFSTVDDHVAFRNEIEGSPFVCCVVEAFREHLAHDHILDILTVVNHKVSKIDIVRKSTIFKQTPEVTHTLRKKVYF